MHTLVVHGGPLGGQRFAVEGPLVIGRENAAVTIPDPSLSRRHASVRPAPGGLEVEDLGSSNGTFVNGERVSVPTLVRPGDVLQMGDTTFAVETGTAAPGAAAGAEPPVTGPTGPQGAIGPATPYPPAAGPGPQYAPPARVPARGQAITKKPPSTNPLVVGVIAAAVLIAGGILLFIFAFGESGKEEFIEQADAICEDTFGELESIEGEIQGAANDPARLQPLLDDLITRLDDTVADIKALDAPDEDRATLDRWFAKVNETLDAGRRLSTALAAGDQQGVAVAGQQFESLSTEVDEIGVQYGFQTCAEDPEA